MRRVAMRSVAWRRNRLSGDGRCVAWRCGARRGGAWRGVASRGVALRSGGIGLSARRTLRGVAMRCDACAARVASRCEAKRGEAAEFAHRFVLAFAGVFRLLREAAQAIATVERSGAASQPCASAQARHHA